MDYGSRHLVWMDSSSCVINRAPPDGYDACKMTWHEASLDNYITTDIRGKLKELSSASFVFGVNPERGFDEILINESDRDVAHEFVLRMKRSFVKPNNSKLNRMLRLRSSINIKPLADHNQKSSMTLR